MFLYSFFFSFLFQGREVRLTFLFADDEVEVVEVEVVEVEVEERGGERGGGDGW